MPALGHSPEQRTDKDDRTAGAESEDETGLPDLLDLCICHDVEQQCRKGKIDDQSVDLARRIWPECTAFPGNPAGKNKCKYG
ncbi:hypothetical protein D3C87_1724340 [compost metagenome]